MTPQEPRRATAADVDTVVGVLVSAFYDDPTWSWAFPDPDRRGEQLQRLWRLFVDGAMRYPWTWLSAGDTSVSVWTPPEGNDLSPEQEQDLWPLLVEIAGDDASRIMRSLERFEAAHPRDTPHFYLGFLGTHRDHAGQGHGLKLLADNLALVDEAGMPAYLEASNPANVALYERYGFVVRQAVAMPDDGPVEFTMWREPSR